MWSCMSYLPAVDVLPAEGDGRLSPCVERQSVVRQVSRELRS